MGEKRNLFSEILLTITNYFSVKVKNLKIRGSEIKVFRNFRFRIKYLFGSSFRPIETDFNSYNGWDLIREMR